MRWWQGLALVLSLSGCAPLSGRPAAPSASGQPGAAPGVVFEIEVPASTPAGAEVWLSGDRQELGSWSGRGVRAEPSSVLRYRAAVALPPGTDFEFKVTRGSWDTVEKGAGGEELQNRVHHVSGGDTLRVRVLNWRDQVAAPPAASTRSGDIREHEHVDSDFVEDRTVLVYLPPGYEEGELRYPVLYLHDGQNVFDRATSFIGVEWGVDEAAERLIRAGVIEPLIIVAVYNTQRRIDEYTPVADGGRGGGADAYGRFLVGELKPFIDSHYRTRPGREDTGVAGSSLGGLVSLHLGLAFPETFSRLGVVSPSVFWGAFEILKEVAVRGHVGSRIWLDMGVEESAGAIDQARRLRDALLDGGWRLDLDLHYLEVPGGRHNEAAWAERVGPLLEFLYPAR